MKNILTILFLFPVFAFAQDCKLKKDTDPFTHVTRISTGFIPFNSGTVKLSLSIDATPNDIDFFFWITGDTKCFDDASTAVVNYDGDRMKGNFRNSGSMNCEGAFHINFRNQSNNPTNLDRILTKKIKSIRLTGANNTITEITFSEDEKAQLMSYANCLVKEAKTLLSPRS
jgi:hypothetical protein